MHSREVMRYLSRMLLLQIKSNDNMIWSKFGLSNQSYPLLSSYGPTSIVSHTDLLVWQILSILHGETYFKEFF